MTQQSSRFAAFAPAHRFAGDERGVSAIEFAVLLPLMLTLYLGGVEVSQAVSADRKNTLVAHTVGDLVAQATNVTSTSGGDIPNGFNSAQWIIYPYPASKLVSRVSSVCVDTNGNATISWSRSSDSNNSAYQTNVAVTSSIPSALLVNNTGAPISYIWGESTYSYKPTIGWTITGTLRLHDQFFLAPRQSCSVTLDGGSKCC
jgi:Flp pilus assembly protein TadG